jgi:hydrogenase maturation protein HypF
MVAVASNQDQGKQQHGMSTVKKGMLIKIKGIVQGVGFRPFIYQQAIRHHLTGWVRNTSSGVEIEVNGSLDDLQEFVTTIKNNPPPLARIDDLRIEPCETNHYTSFEILESKAHPGEFIPISPDVSICDDCTRELFYPQDRRYRYPFINCTNCGPRFTIIQDIPYDRPNTTMSGFEMCPDCRHEYENPLDRRFHAQPVACPKCGPQVWLEKEQQILEKGEDAISVAREWLRDGKILAIKGLGGYHLACDAANDQAVNNLRERKKRSDKPFALMAFDLEVIRRHCKLTAEEEELLLSPQHPIVILDRRPKSDVSPMVAPQQPTLGVMLPYTPLHMLLLEPAPGYPEMFVMTSGNLSEEPIAYIDEDAKDRLQGLADGFLLNDRPIHIRTDDSVTRVADKKMSIIRRARGYAPDPIRLPFDVKSVLAAGAELKNTFCITRDRYAFISHHIGDLENFETYQSFKEGVEHFKRIFKLEPQAIACDLHPDYLATRYALAESARQVLPLYHIQHHHAHLASCLADNQWDESGLVIGLCFDGTGMGTDGAIWGGEILLGNYEKYIRAYHLAYTPLPGGDTASRKASRTALSHLWSAGIDWDMEIPAVSALCGEERNIVRTQMEKNINAPLTSSMGRLFDAVSAILGICQESTYEGQAAIELENACDTMEFGSYPFAYNGNEILQKTMLEALMQDWYSGTPVPVLASRFHNSLVNMVLDRCKSIRESQGINTIAMSGGVWQNRFLFTRSINSLKDSGFNVLYHRQVPTNDGGLSLGQAVIAAHAYQNLME